MPHYIYCVEGIFPLLSPLCRRHLCLHSSAHLPPSLSRPHLCALQELADLERRWRDELGYTPPDAQDLVEFYGRPINSGELACFASHHAGMLYILVA